jgi:hypothetical protein
MSDLSQLERRLRRTELVVLALVLVIMILGLVNLGLLARAVFANGTMRARAFVMLDAKGVERGALRMGADGPELTLRNGGGDGRVYLGAPNDAAILQLCDGKGQPRLSASAEPSGSGLGLLDKRHQVRTELKLTQNNPGLFMKDAQATIRLGLGVGAQGPGMYLNDVSGRNRAELCVLGNDVVRLLFRDEQERNRVLIAHGKKEGTFVQRLDAKGIPMKEGSR